MQCFLRPCARLSSSVSHCRRTLFTLPDLASLSPFSPPNGKSETITYHERKIFPYRRNQLYDVVADVTSYPKFLPFCTSSRILTSSERTSSPPIVDMDAELTVGFLSFTESYVSRVTCTPFESVEAVASSATPLFKTLTTTWQFQPASPRSPHLSTGTLPHPGRQSSSLAALREGRAETSHENGPTLVTLDLAYAFANPVHATVSAAFFGQVSKLMVKAFEERCLSVYGPGRK